MTYTAGERLGTSSHPKLPNGAQVLGPQDRDAPDLPSGLALAVRRTDRTRLGRELSRVLGRHMDAVLHLVGEIDPHSKAEKSQVRVGQAARVG